MAGPLTDDLPTLELELLGYGRRHMCAFRPTSDPCSRCDAKGFLGHPAFPLICPCCKGEKVVAR